MIDLRKVPHKIVSAEPGGSLQKYWVEIKGKRYMFKSNYLYPDCETRTNFGEVLYSKLGKKFGFNTTNAQIAIGEIGGKAVTGVLIENYLSPLDVDTMSSNRLGCMVAVDEDMWFLGNCANAHLKEALTFAKNEGLRINARAMRDDLLKMAIADFFLGQGDRHQENIEYIFDKYGGMRLAPCFDNGHCLGLRLPDAIAEKYIQEIKHGTRKNYLGDDVIYTVADYMFTTSAQKSRLNMFEIAKLCPHNPELKKLVVGMLHLDIGKEIEEIENESGIKLEDNYKELATYIFNAKRDAFMSIVSMKDFEDKGMGK